MDTKEKLVTTLHEAMKNNNEVVKRTLRMVLTNVKLAEVEKGVALDETSMLALLQKEIRMRNESIAEAEKANRPDLAASNHDEIAVLESFLPKQMSEDELRALVAGAIDEVQAKLPSDMGKVMKTVLPKIQGRAANDQISRVVREMLSKNS